MSSDNMDDSSNQSTNQSTSQSIPAFTSSFQLDPTQFPNFTPFTTVNQSTNQSTNQSPNRFTNQSINQSTSQSPITANRPSNKRSLDDFDDEEDDLPKYKRLRDDSDDESEVDQSTNQPISQSINAEDGDDPLERDSFLSLLTHFAALHVPSDLSQACPVCEQMFPLIDLASHAFECLKSLDDVERKEQEKLDEKLARSLMEHEIQQAGGSINQSIGHLIDNAHFDTTNADFESAMENDEIDGDELIHSTDQAMDESTNQSINQSINRTQSISQTSTRVCPNGAACIRTDAQHFMLATHPLVECPICTGKVQIYEINAHINLCLGNEPAINQSINQSSNNQSINQSINPAFTQLREHEPITRQDSSRPLPVDDAESDDDTIDPALVQATINQSVNQPINQSINHSINQLNGQVSRSYSTSRQLTIEQASAMASMVIKRRDALIGKSDSVVDQSTNQSINQSIKASDPSLAQLLDTFKTLGFTQEGLSKLKEQSNSQSSMESMQNKNGEKSTQ